MSLPTPEPKGSGPIPQETMRLPEWLRHKHSIAELASMKRLLRRHRLSTVCEEARCPNQRECFRSSTATFLILGDTCTRGCGFCCVGRGRPGEVDPGEPSRVAEAAREMGLRHVVITSVTRDDLGDGGASQFRATIIAVRETLPGATVEALTPDFGGETGALALVLGARPDVFNHNLETVPSLYVRVRAGAGYERSLGVLRLARETLPGACLTKSGLMLGLGETLQEVRRVLVDLRAVGCDMLTIGQYMRPSKANLPVVRYVEPGEFAALGDEARAMGFRHVASGPGVRSSWHAGEMYGKV